MQTQPILYSFRRCPYAIRARLAIYASGQNCQLREVVLKHKPPELIAASAKATVPVLITEQQQVIDESLLIMQWALQGNDPHNWLGQPDTKLNIKPNIKPNIKHSLIEKNDGYFKHYLDRYKYFDRYPQASQQDYLEQALVFVSELEEHLQQSQTAWLLGEQSVVDMALLPFVRQFAFVDKNAFDQLPYPNVQSWLNNFLSSALFSAVMNKYPAWQAQQDPVIFGEPNEHSA